MSDGECMSWYLLQLETMLDVPSEVRLLISSGIVPERLFSRNDNIDNSDKLPINDSIDPEKLLLSAMKYCSFFSLYKFSGRDPLNALF